MKTLNPYLMFSGNCREALTFYQECLGGEITSIQTYAESPLGVPDEHGHRIFNAVFRADELLLRASDDMPNHPVTRGSNFALFVAFSDKEEQERSFATLSEWREDLLPVGERIRHAHRQVRYPVDAGARGQLA